MISRFLSIAAVSLVVAAGSSVAGAAEDAALVREVQGMLIKRGYLADYHKDWDQCSQRAAASFLSDEGKAGTLPELDDIAQELKKAPADVHRDGKPVCERSDADRRYRWIGAVGAVRAALPEFLVARNLSGSFEQEAARGVGRRSLSEPHRSAGCARRRTRLNRRSGSARCPSRLRAAERQATRSWETQRLS